MSLDTRRLKYLKKQLAQAPEPNMKVIIALNKKSKGGYVEVLSLDHVKFVTMDGKPVIILEHES